MSCLVRVVGYRANTKSVRPIHIQYITNNENELRHTPQLYIGLDVHKEKSSVAIADPGATGEIRHHGEVATTQVALDRLIRRIAKSKNIPLSRISVCYEAGGCGMWIARMLHKMKVPCTVVMDRCGKL